jgi:tetratricopeptide (TPR) repeat protein
MAACAIAAVTAIAPLSATPKAPPPLRQNARRFSPACSTPPPTGRSWRLCAAVDPARDFEAAAATLERLIDLEPANATARLELATAYFAMGNYPLAEFHLNAAAASGALSAEQLASAEAYRGAAAGTRTRPAGSRAPSRRGSSRPMARSAFWAPAR